MLRPPGPLRFFSVSLLWAIWPAVDFIRHRRNGCLHH